jgi:hypothetical protein
MGLSMTAVAMFKNSCTELILGNGRLIGEKRVEVELKNRGKRIVTAANIIICTGCTLGSKTFKITCSHLWNNSGGQPTTGDAGLEATVSSSCRTAMSTSMSDSAPASCISPPLVTVPSFCTLRI